jgi:cell division protein FtsL
MKHQMKVYKAEKDAGLSDVLRSCASVAYIAKVEPIDPSTRLARKFIKAVASEEHPEDTLFPLRDILVTSGWNLNTDVFDGGEMWMARYTPENHPLNFEHDEKRIIGHITASQAVDEDFNPLDDTLVVEELPPKYHILNGSVIYRAWHDEQQRELIEKTIAEIKAGEWYMSMECLFKGFDYAVVRPDGTSAIIARNEESAFLTKHLRQYGGTGTYKCETSGNEFKLGRVLRNIAFIGKGLVRKPANPESVILNNVSAFTSSFADLGYITAEAEVTSTKSERNDMSEVNNDVKRLEEKVAELVRQNETLASQLKDKDSQAVRAEIDGLKADITSRDNKITTLEAQVKELTEAVQKVTKRAEDAEASKNDLQTEINSLKAEKVEKERLALLTGKGASAEKAAELIKKFANFSDEQFAETVELLSAAWKSTTSNHQRKPEDVVRDVKPADKDAALATTDEDPEVARAARISHLSEKFIRPVLRYTNNVGTTK